MIKYVAISTAAKAFSLNDTTRAVYRKLGNVVLEKMRVSGGITQPYVDRAVRLVDYCDRLELLAPGDKVLELGTGWIHWEATVLRLFFDVEVTLYDVWDNRLLGAYTSWLAQLHDRIDDEFAHLSEARRGQAKKIARQAMDVRTFEELYRMLNFTYVVDASGTLKGVPQNHYALAVSADVLEHVQGEQLPSYLADMRRCLIPGGASVHQIDLVDHFHYFDTKASPKNYYRYSDKAWRRWFESDVQYFNRIQRPTWIRLFENAGFELDVADNVSAHLAPLKLAPVYRDLRTEDLDCMQLLVVHRNPSS
jgi:Methyltransferase domain